MMEKELFNTEQKALDIAQKIKAFTFLVPTDCGIADPSYKRYLVTCSRLLELDVSLNGLQNDDEIEYDELIESLLDIEHEVDECTKWLGDSNKKN